MKPLASVSIRRVTWRLPQAAVTGGGSHAVFGAAVKKTTPPMVPEPGRSSPAAAGRALRGRSDRQVGSKHMLACMCGSI